ncbi:MAG: DUF1015 domain-containing protein [Bacteroidota bacterium]|nr:DUF1015 domain-containing protein [Bacteroidota bacterium]
MATIRPFKAIRPNRDKAHLVASRSYLTYSQETLKEKLENNPYTFLRIINPEYNKQNKKSGIEKFKLVKKKFIEFREKGYLVQDEKPAFYLYQQQKGQHIFEGIIAATSIEDYNDGFIKIHEDTITKREEMFKDYLNVTGFNADPVLLSYKDDEKINNLISKKQSTRPEYEFTTTNKVLHKLWIINDNDCINTIISSFEDIDSIYIADGHHRTASSALLAKIKNIEEDSNLNYFMSFLISEKQLNIINFNRLIKNLKKLSATDFLEKIAVNFDIKKSVDISPKNKDEIGMYLQGESYLLTAKKGSYPEDCVNRLDPVILSKNILSPILGILDEKTEKNISFVSGDTPLCDLKTAVDNAKNAVAFILKPIPVEALKKIAENGKIMPPKSTYIEPKLRSGLTIYSID